MLSLVDIVFPCVSGAFSDLAQYDRNTVGPGFHMFLTYLGHTQLTKTFSYYRLQPKSYIGLPRHLQNAEGNIYQKPARYSINVTS